MTKEEMKRDTYTLAYYCDHWLAAKSMRLKASSCAKYRAEMENHIKPFWGNHLPAEITTEEMERFTEILLHEKGLSSRTTRNILALFHSVFIYAERRSGQKLQNLEMVYPREQKKNIRVLDEKEEKELMNLLAREMNPEKLGIYLSLRTGMRIGEICALKWSDISFRAGTISICRTVQRLKVPNMDTPSKTELFIGAPKSDSSFRTIPLMPDMAALCARFYPGIPETFVLTGTSQCMEPRKLQRHLKKYTDACKLKEVHFHTLRHTFATRCIEVGFDVKTLSEILGHSNISVTLNQYVHPNMDLKRENMSRLKTGICL